MTTQNTIDVGLALSTGSGKFVGSITPTIQTPVIVDANGVDLLTFTTTSSAINYLTITNSITTKNPQLSATGTDTNIVVNIIGKGANGGGVVLGTNDGGTIFSILGLSVLPTGTMVNSFDMIGTSTGIAPYISSTGSDTNVGFNVVTQGLGVIALQGNLGSITNIATFTPVASAVNYFAFTNAATTTSPTMAAAGSDTNVVLTLKGQGTGGVAIQGTSAASAGNASAGYVGELISSVIAVASAVSCTSPNARDVTSIALTAGDWDVWGNVFFTVGGLSTQLYCWLSSSSATLPDVSLVTGDNPASGDIGSQGFSCASQRFNVPAAGITVYLSCKAIFSTSTVTACGGIYARRRR